MLHIDLITRLADDCGCLLILDDETICLYEKDGETIIFDGCDYILDGQYDLAYRTMYKELIKRSLTIPEAIRRREFRTNYDYWDNLFSRAEINNKNMEE
jgi:hypothetical protein